MVMGNIDTPLSKSGVKYVIVNDGYYDALDRQRAEAKARVEAHDRIARQDIERRSSSLRLSSSLVLSVMYVV
jgi:hypothetical protein